MTRKDAPAASRTKWQVLVAVATIVAAASIVLITLEPQLIGSYFTLVGMVCVIWTSVANLRRIKQ
jgi:hypothetical protein